MACPGGGTAVTDAARVRELSEKDVMTVLDMIRKEFNVDERRIYLMGHSMGGSGTLYLGAKHASVWAAVAAIAPPGALGAGSADGLAAAKMPVFVVQGDMDTAVPVAGTRRYIDRLKELNATYEYLEIPGADHSITGIPEIYKFFEKHSKPAR
jgi:dipeptidyl aminopeptidase/acylaminoacyl peptidase